MATGRQPHTALQTARRLDKSGGRDIRNWWELQPRGCSTDSAHQLAEAVKVVCKGGAGGIDPREMITQAGWRLRTARLGGGGSHVQALLVPLQHGGFEVVVDHAPTLVEENLIQREVISRADVRDFRIAHEIGHSFFYRQEVPAKRSRRPSINEERFCDEFAWSLLALPSWEWRQPTASCVA